MNIPSNFSLAERLKYISLDAETLQMLEKEVDNIKSLEKEIEKIDERCDRYYEQMQFCKDFIAEAMDILRAAELKADFIEARIAIEMLLENSYVEL